MLSEQLAMKDWSDKSTSFTSSTSTVQQRCSGTALVDSPSSCLSSGYCSDDAASGHGDVFFGRHGKDCWMSSADVDTVDLLRCSLPPFDADLCSSAASAAAAVSHDDTAVKFDDIVDNWLFNSMSVPSPCVDNDWPLHAPPAPTPSTSTSEGLEDLPTDSVLADLLLNQFAYTAAATPAVRPPQPTIDSAMPLTSSTVEPNRKPSPEPTTTASASSSCQTVAVSVVISAATKRTLEADSCEPSAARRRRSSPCWRCSDVLEVASLSSLSSSALGGTTAKSHRAAAVCCDCSSADSAPGLASAATEVDLSRLQSALRPEWPGFADLVVSRPAAVCTPDELSDSVAVCDETNKTTVSSTENGDDAEETSSSNASCTEPSRTVATRPVILEALLRSSSKLDASRGSSGLLVIHTWRPISAVVMHMQNEWHFFKCLANVLKHSCKCFRRGYTYCERRSACKTFENVFFSFNHGHDRTTFPSVCLYLTLSSSS